MNVSGDVVEHVVRPVGVVRSGRTDIAMTDNWGEVTSTIVVDDRFGHDCLLGLEEFSPVDVLFLFDQTTERSDYSARRPRGRADLPEVGLFADSGPRRPNLIGVTTCRILSVDGRSLKVVGLDAVDGTPVVDLKPTMLEFLPADVRQPDWVSRLMADYFRP